MNYKEVLEDSGIPFLTVDEGGYVIEVSKAACALLEYRQEKIIGTSYDKIITEETKIPCLKGKNFTRSGFGILNSGEKIPIKYKLYAKGDENNGGNSIIITIFNQQENSSKNNVTSRERKEDDFQFSRLFTENPSAGWIVDQKSLRFLDVNASAINDYGYSKEEFLTKTIFDILPLSEYHRLKEALENKKSLANIYTGHWKNVLKNGDIIDVDIPKNIMDGSDRIILLAIDITSQLANENFKERERSDIDPLINSTLDQIWSISLDYKLIASNKSFTRLLEIATGKTFKPGDDLFEHPFTRNFTKIWHPYFKRAITGERVKEVVHIPEYSNLPARWVELFINAVFKEDKIVGAVFYTRNITESKIAEQKIIESEANLAEAQRLANLGNWSKNLVTGELKWSEQLFEIYGLKKDLETKTIRPFLKLVDDSNKKELLDAMKQTRRTGEPYSIIYHITTPQGEKKIIEEKGYGTKNKNGQVIHTFGTAQDITQKMMTEEALRISNESYNLVSKATNDSIWDWDMETGIVSRSGNGFKILFGYENDFGNDKNHIYEELIHPEDKEFVKASQNKVFENPNENYWEAEFRFIKANGKYAHVYDRGYIIRDQSGNPKRMIGASQDITLQKEHLNEITRIQRNLQAVINTTEDLIWSLDLDLKVITANKAFSEFMLHLFPENIREGENIISPLLEKRIADRWISLYNKVIQGEKFSLEYEVFHQKLKEWKFYIISFSPILNREGFITGIACSARDITQLKISALELKHSQERFKDLFHLSPQPMWLYEKDTYKIVEINKAAINHYGYSEEEFLSMTIMDIRPPEEVSKVQNIINNRRSGSAPDFNQVFKHLKKNGELIEVQIYSTPLVIDDKKYTLIVAIDVTEKKRYEHNINKAIIKAQENERFEIGSELHDNICQLLASSKMRISILKEHIPQEKMVIFQESKDFIVTALDEIRNLSHRLAPSFFNDKTLEEAFVKLFNSFNFLKKYKIKLNFSESVLKQNLSLDLKLNLYRILQEQLKNIVKYAKASEIDVEVSLCQSKILKMRIADNGLGFNLTEVKHGIGISNMKRRAELSDGELVLKTSPGNGTEIIVTIPLEGDV